MSHAPRNGVYIVQGELNHVVGALRRNSRWSGGHFHQDEEQDSLLQRFSQLKDTLQDLTDINEVDVNVVLGPFLEVIRSEDTTGPITGVALSSVNKFLSYGLIDPACESASSGIENLADAVTHARFVGTDPSSDEVVLMKILQVLRTLLLSPVGVHMTNESVCEIMQSCFRICFEMRLSELLRRTAEQTLIDMVQLLFLRLPQFKEDIKSIFSAPHIRKMLKRGGALSSTRRTNKRLSPKTRHKHIHNQRHSNTDSPTVSGVQAPRPHVQAEGESDSLTTDNSIKNTENSDSVTDNVSHSTTDDNTCISNSSEDDSLPVLSEAKDRSVSSGSFEMIKDPPIPINDNVIIERCEDDVDSNASGTEIENNREDMESFGSPALLTQGKSDDKSEWNSSSLVSGGVISLHYPEEDSNRTECDNSAISNVQSTDTTQTEQLEKSNENLSDNVRELPDKQSSPIEKSHKSNENEKDGVIENRESQAEQQEEYFNQQGVRFTPQESAKEGHGPLIPYGLPSVRELLRFLITLINPTDRHNTNTMIHIGLSLLTVALESGARNIGQYISLMNLVKDDLCKNLFGLLQCDIHILFSLSMRACFLLFEGLRVHLKYQLEMFFVRLMDVLMLEHISVPYEKREMALEYINQMFHLPGMISEIYVNYDCDMSGNNILEDLCKVLSKNAFRPGNLSSVNLLALDALLTVVNQIEHSCQLMEGQDSKRNGGRSERTISTSSDRTGTGEDESETEEAIDYYHYHGTPGGIGLATSGYAVGRSLLSSAGFDQGKKDPLTTEKGRSESDASGISLPSMLDLCHLKQKKKLLWQGIEEFNKKAKKGIEFLQQHNILSTPLDPTELAHFFKDNQRVDKKIIGDYIGERRNTATLAAFIKLFEMKGQRLDESLRQFLETFRLPGEAPVISLILEQFCDSYFEKNPGPYANKDAAFTMAYAVIMLNVDQHNAIVKQQKSMTIDEFKRNLRSVNGGQDFAASLLEQIFQAIKTDEIVMPSERTGKVKENYDWKMLLRKGSNQDAQFCHCPASVYDKDIFVVVWGPTVAALSYIYDNGLDKTVVQKAINGFRKCAVISAHYGLSEVFDNLLISLCKFTTLLIQGEPSDNLPVTFGSNIKAQISSKTVFALAHKYGDILREGWQNLLVCILQLFKARLLPEALTETDDFIEQSGRISLIREDVTPVARADSSGLFSSFYTYLLANPDTPNIRAQTAEERQAQSHAIECIQQCRTELLITESKFLRVESLQELVKALVLSSKPETALDSTELQNFDQDAAVFFLEFLIRVVDQNRDRVTLLWQTVRDHLSNIIVSAHSPSFLIERAVVGLIRLAIRLIRKDEIGHQVLIALRILFLMKPTVLQSCSRHIAYGIHELIRTNAANITFSRDWVTALTLVEVVGAGSLQPTVKPGPSLTMIATTVEPLAEVEHIEEETGEVCRNGKLYPSDTNPNPRASPIPTDVVEEPWLLVNKEDNANKNANLYNLEFGEKLNRHDSRSFIKTAASLSFIIRDAAHITKQNIFQCLHAVLLFSEASKNGGNDYRRDEIFKRDTKMEAKQSAQKASKRKKRTGSPKTRRAGSSSPRDFPRSEDDAEINENTSNIYDAISLQLLDLMYTLHTNAARILENVNWEQFAESQREEARMRCWSSKDSIDQLPSTFKGDNDCETSLLWTRCWCPLLQGIARLCCDSRREIRMSALTVLQRSLLVPDLKAISAVEWESCFNKVLFPMLSRLLELSCDSDPVGLEETRMRAATLLCKAFLQRLSPLLSLTTFTALWMTILDCMDRYMNVENSDLLYEAIPESLKNMLLVMSTAGIFEEATEATQFQLSVNASANVERSFTPSPNPSDSRQYSALWQVTWERIDCFLPNLRQDLINTRSPSRSMASSTVPEPQAMVMDGRSQADEAQEAVEDDESATSDDANTKSQTLDTANARLTPNRNNNLESGQSSPELPNMNVVLQPPLPDLHKNNRPCSPISMTSDLLTQLPQSGVPVLVAPKPLGSERGSPSTIQEKHLDPAKQDQPHLEEDNEHNPARGCPSPKSQVYDI